MNEDRRDTTRLPADPSQPDWDDDRIGRVDYRSRLRELDDELVAVAADVADAIPPAGAALLSGDRSAIPLKQARDARNHRRCRRLEDACIVLIAREAPVAADLREVVAVVRAITDLERASRLIVHIVSALDRIHPPGMQPELRTTLRLLCDAADRTFRGAAAAWQDRDGLAVNELTRLDDDVDHLQEKLLSELYLGDHPVEDVVALALLGRYFERLADHGVALAAHLSWAVTGDRIGAT